MVDENSEAALAHERVKERQINRTAARFGKRSGATRVTPRMFFGSDPSEPTPKEKAAKRAKNKAARKARRKGRN